MAATSEDTDTGSESDQDPEAHSVRQLHASDLAGDSDQEDAQEALEQLEKIEQRMSQILADSHENLLPRKKLIIVFMALATSLLLSFIDQTGITVALPHIADELNAQETSSWAGTASFIGNTVSTVLFGRFSDIFSRKYTLIASLIILAFSDLACALAQNAYQFYIFRGFAGVGNAGITSLTMMITSDVVTLRDRGKYQGILGGMVGTGNAVGPFLASAFITHETWRKYFYMLFPIGIFVSGIILWLVPYTHHKANIKDKILSIDYLGFFFSSVGIIFILIPLSGGGSTYEWKSGFVIAFFLVGGVALIVFLVIENYYAELPIIPMKLFRTSLSLNLLMAQNFFYGMVYFSSTYYFPYYLQVIRGKTIIQSSEYMLAVVITQVVVSIVSGYLITQLRHYIHILWFGFSTWTIACGLFLIWTYNCSDARLVIPLVLAGLGMGATFQPTMVAAQAQSYKKDRAIVISTRNVIRSFGGAVGLAIANTMITNYYIKQLNTAPAQSLFTASEIATLKSQIFTVHDYSSYPADQAKFLKESYMGGLKTVFYLWIASIGLCVLSLVTVRDTGLDPIDVKKKMEEEEAMKKKEETVIETREVKQDEQLNN